VHTDFGGGYFMTLYRSYGIEKVKDNRTIIDDRGKDKWQEEWELMTRQDSWRMWVIKAKILEMIRWWQQDTTNCIKNIRQQLLRHKSDKFIRGKVGYNKTIIL
jgi:hypothetical protein